MALKFELNFKNGGTKILEIQGNSNEAKVPILSYLICKIIFHFF